MSDPRNYPNGFFGRSSGLGLPGDPDPEMVVLYQDFLARRSGWTWEMQRPYFEAALRLFGCPAWFLERQMRIPGLCRYRRQFLIDTAEFIVTGRRPTSVYTVTSLFDYRNPSMPMMFDAGAIPKGVDSIARWVSHEGGFADMVESMAVFFGPKGPVAGA